MKLPNQNQMPSTVDAEPMILPSTPNNCRKSKAPGVAAKEHSNLETAALFSKKAFLSKFCDESLGKFRPKPMRGSRN